MVLQKSGQLRGLNHDYKNPIQYYLQLGEEEVHLNPFIGQTIEFNFQGEIHCIHCGRKIKKTYNNGSCYPCFTSLPQNDLCILKPELCHLDQGTCRDEAFAHSHCLIPHYVYLALSSDVKVGITRKNRSMTRWVDQGAVQSIPIAEVPDRKTAGELEVFLSNHLPDKTNWRKMLKGDLVDKDILEIRKKVLELIPEQFAKYLLSIEEVNEFVYPISETLDKIKSLSFDKSPTIEGKLLGLKGQYLIFDIGVLNIKKHSGYQIEIKLVF